jgi:HK97 family phage portal protein
MLHIRGFGEGPVGVNVIEYAAQSIGWARATAIFGATYFRQGMNPSGIVTGANGLKPGGLAELREELKKLYAGPKGERTVILDKGMTFERLATTPEDSQFIETRQHQVEEICRWFGVPPHKVMHLLRATFSNIEHQSIEVVVDSVAPWVHVWEDEADYKLFGPQNRQGYCTRMDLKGLMRGDAKSRAEYYFRRWQMGSMTVNDILRAENENTIGNEGDVRFVPANMMTLERAMAAGPQPGADPNQDQLPDPALGEDDPNSSALPNGGLNGRRLQH